MGYKCGSYLEKAMVGKDARVKEFLKTREIVVKTVLQGPLKDCQAMEHGGSRGSSVDSGLRRDRAWENHVRQSLMVMAATLQGPVVTDTSHRTPIPRTSASTPHWTGLQSAPLYTRHQRKDLREETPGPSLKAFCRTDHSLPGRLDTVTGILSLQNTTFLSSEPHGDQLSGDELSWASTQLSPGAFKASLRQFGPSAWRTGPQDPLLTTQEPRSKFGGHRNQQLLCWDQWELTQFGAVDSDNLGGRQVRRTNGSTSVRL
ncbi:hypothetical protein QTO34_001582 [Cnephaeus nilssonii]|uniref:Uncharacterized protein n=1 Tax=Cnephaeus nilssonii TaxID=3371016 RepID=A0AA40HWY2_CNENI|nr:hypothetical protein QTO34_001582 [Eptesicus nilssonii]